METRRKVLVIDDSETVQLQLRGTLSELGYDIFGAFDGVQGLMMARERQPDIIILDINMPAGGGATVYERLRGLNSTIHIPIILYTGMSHIELEQLGSLPPGITVVTKSADPMALPQAIKKLLR